MHQRKILAEKWQIYRARERLWETKKKMEEGKGKRHAPTETTKAMRHISEFVSVMFTSVISQSCSHSEGAKQKGKVFQQLERQNNLETKKGQFT